MKNDRETAARHVCKGPIRHWLLRQVQYIIPISSNGHHFELKTLSSLLFRPISSTYQYSSLAMPRNGKRKQRPWESDEPVSSRRAIVRKDPFQYLCWGCASIILSYVDVQDLARCERVDQGWRQFVHE
jgi:hypothetical protein